MDQHFIEVVTHMEKHLRELLMWTDMLDRHFENSRIFTEREASSHAMKECDVSEHIDISISILGQVLAGS